MIFKERRILYRDDLRNLCIKKQWYTRGDCAEYENMLSMTGDGKKHITTSDIVAIAEDIMAHTDEPERSLESYCFEIAKISCTFFEPENDSLIMGSDMETKLYAENKSGETFILSQNVEKDAAQVQMTVKQYMEEIECLNPYFVKVYTI